MAFTVGIGFTNMVLEQMEIHPLTLTVSVNVKLPIVVPVLLALTVTEAPVLDPEILPLPEIDHECVVIPVILGVEV